MTDKQKLTDVVSEGLTLVHCTGDHKMMLDIERAMCEAKLTCVSTRWMTSMNAIGYVRSWLDALAHRRIDDKALVVVSRVPVLSQGFQLPFHRIVWMGRAPAITSPSYAVYVNATRRGELDTPVIHFTGEIK